MLRERSADHTAGVAARMGKAWVVPLDADTAYVAAEISLEHGLAMADAIVYATALAYGATLVTSDAHLRDLPHVEYLSPDAPVA